MNYQLVQIIEQQTGGNVLCTGVMREWQDFDLKGKLGGAPAEIGGRKRRLWGAIFTHS
jgi:hypothetical protein